jgi:hypothetical protein
MSLTLKAQFIALKGNTETEMKRVPAGASLSAAISHSGCATSVQSEQETIISIIDPPFVRRQTILLTIL